MAFDSISSAESIATLCTALTALIGGIATFIYKVRGKSFREIMQDLFENKTKETQELTEVVKTQTKAIKDIVEREMNKKDIKKG